MKRLFKTKTANKSTLKNEDVVKPASFRQMMRYATKTEWLLLIIGLVCAGLNGTFFVGNLIIFGKLTDVIITGQSQYQNGELDAKGFKSAMLDCSLTYFACAAIILVFGFLGVSLIHLVCERQAHRIKQKYLSSILNQDIAWFDKNEIGKLSEKMTVWVFRSQNLIGIDRIKAGSGKTIALIVQAVIGQLAGIVISFIISWRISILMLVFLPVLILSIYGSGAVVKIMLKKETKAYQMANAVAEEVLSGIRTVTSFNAQEFELDRFKAHLQIGFKSGMRKAIWSAFFAALYNFVIFGSMGVLFWYGSNLAIYGFSTPGTVQAIFWLFAIGAIRVGQAAPSFSSVMHARLAASELFIVIDRIPEMDSANSSGLKPLKIEGEISFKNLHFRYPSRPEMKVLNGVSFDVPKGKTIALVGKSGCGKSTIISILMRFYNLEAGTITLDGRSIKDFNVEWLRNTISIVPQEAVLFSGTIEENLRMGKEDASFQEMQDACKMANADEFITKLPKGYKTLIGDGNIILSGGQKQRLAIARALVRKPKILLLDEATSALDNDSERIVQEAIAASNRTCIYIAHRLSTIRNADKILVFDRGEIVESGSHNELISIDNGVYKSLIRAQEIEKSELEDVVVSETDDVSLYQQPIIRRTIELLSMHSARSSLAPVQFEVWVYFLLSQITQLYSEIPDQFTSENNQKFATENTKQLKPLSFIKILRFARPEKLYIIVGFVLSIARGASWPFYTLLLGKLFRNLSAPNVIVAEIAHQNMITGLLFGALAIYSSVLTFVSGSMLGVTGEKIVNRLRIITFKNLLRQDCSFYDKVDNSVGKLIARLSRDAPNVKAALDERLADVLQSLTSFSIGIIAGLLLDWRMAICEICAVSLTLAIQLILLHYLKQRTIADAQIEEEVARIATDAIQNVKTIQTLNRQKYLNKKFADASIVPNRRSIQRGLLEAMTIAVSITTETLNFAIIYTIGAFIISAGYVSPIIAFQVVSVVNAGIIMTFLPAASYVPEFIRARVSAALMFRMINEPAEINNMSDKGLRPNFHGNIQIKHVYFSYPNQKQLVLKDFNVNAYRGQILALVGPSGSGKSTTIQIIERYYDVLSGNVCIDDVDIRQINIRHLRDNMALVGQEPTLFNLSIRDNISYGMKNVSDEQIFEAAKLANIHDFVETLPQKYETIVGSRASRLSGGQKQRLAIARAVIRNPKILLLDEATSALDTESEKLVQIALENVSEGRTCVVIAHRLSTIQHADVIAVVKDGHVIEQGSHQQLLNRKGLYYRLVQKHND